MVSDPAKEAALARAFAALERADRTLAEPRPQGEAWEGKERMSQPVTYVPPPEPRTHLPRPLTDRLPQSDIRMVLGLVGREVGAVVKSQRDRIDDLEQRLGAVEALLAKAKGSTQ